MSFSAAYTLAEQRGLNPDALQPGNSADEAAATAILAEAIPATLKQGWEFLTRLALAVRESGHAWDICLDCTVAGTDELAGRAGIFQPGLKYPGLVRYMPEEQKIILRQVARLSMFDLPRGLVAEKLGLWVHNLFAAVYVLSPTPEVDMGWAMQRHAVRQRWVGVNTPEPETLSVEASAAWVTQTLTTTHGKGWRHLMDWHTVNPPGDPFRLDGADTVELADDLHAVIGSFTGREILCKATGRSDWQYYNCHNPGTGGVKPSAVVQLQNQHPTLENC